jgi:hypothetical protein
MICGGGVSVHLTPPELCGFVPIAADRSALH